MNSPQPVRIPTTFVAILEPPSVKAGWGAALMFDREDFIWKGSALHYGKRRTPALTLAADATYPHLFRIVYPNGWTSTPANLTHAKDAAYDHARYLLRGQRPDSDPQTGERVAA
jgi:hypothetical protein